MPLTFRSYSIESLRNSSIVQNSVWGWVTLHMHTQKHNNITSKTSPNPPYKQSTHTPQPQFTLFTQNPLDPIPSLVIKPKPHHKKTSKLTWVSKKIHNAHQLFDKMPQRRNHKKNTSGSAESVERRSKWELRVEEAVVAALAVVGTSSSSKSLTLLTIGSFLWMSSGRGLNDNLLMSFSSLPPLLQLLLHFLQSNSPSKTYKHLHTHTQPCLC